MSTTIKESELPRDLTAFEAVELAYPDELARAERALTSGLAVMIECDKGLTPFLYRCLRDRLKKRGLKSAYLDGRPTTEADPAPGGLGLMATIIGSLREAVRASVDQRLLVLPHLDLLTTTSGGLSAEAKEVIPLLYENPNILWLGFKDPSFRIPKVIETLFPHRISMLGVPRDRLHFLVTQREARKLSREGFRPYELYKYVSGVNAARLRTVLSALSGEDYPADSSHAWNQIREATLQGDLSVPTVRLKEDIGGYPHVKDRIEKEILEIIARKEAATDPGEIERIEKLIPRGIIFSGPPGTGKTHFAKAMASALGAAAIVVSGPELKSRWVGESEENLRQIFVRARQSAPAIIIFDELDSFASARGMHQGSGVEHSMVNQLLTEMDGFRSNEMVFVVGTTNFLESIDPALLRPGRFEFHIPVPYPGPEDRRAILEIYDRRFALRLDEAALEYAVRRTGSIVEGGGRYSGDHLHALCRAIARRRLRSALAGPTDVNAVEEALSENLDRPQLTASEERVVATHEAGHAVVALHLEHAAPIERITIRGDLSGALGYVAYADPANRYVITKSEILDRLAILFGGREAESVLLTDISLGASHDLAVATEMATAAVVQYGMGPPELSVREFGDDKPLAEETRRSIDRATSEILDAQRARARAIIERERGTVVALRDLLLEKKVVDRAAILALGREAKDHG
jgi:cell division protease FtsH